MAWPLIVAGAVAAAAGLAGAGGGAAAGVGKNTTRPTGYTESGAYDPNRFNYGGTPGGADADASRYRSWADQAQTRGGVQTDYSRANDWDAYAAGQAVNAQGARGAQGDMAGLMAARARGEVPSIASMQARNDMGLLQQSAANQSREAQAAQMAAAASARGGAGMALAQQNAANNTANAQGAINQGLMQGMTGISNQAQVNAANERLQAENSAFGAYTGMRGGDQSGQGLGYQGMQNAAQMGQFNANLGMQQRGLNDAMTLGMTGNEMAVQNARLQAGMHQQGLVAASHDNAESLRMGAGQKNADRQMDFLKMGVGALQGGASMASMGTKAEGGPVRAGKPYLVGERGPEVIIPQRHGYVLTAPQTRAALAKGGQGLMAGMGARSMQDMLTARQADLDAQRIHNEGGDVGAEVLRTPFDASQGGLVPRRQTPEDARQSAEASNRAMGLVPAASPEQAAFEARLTGQPLTREQSNMLEMEKIRANFARSPEAGTSRQMVWNEPGGEHVVTDEWANRTAQWERSFGPASQTFDAGVRGRGGLSAPPPSARDANAGAEDPYMAMYRKRMMAGLLGGAG